jgi:GNAT superfamily N-acetyltransferase
MFVSLRPLNFDTDALRYVELLNTILFDPVDEDRVREWARNFPQDGIRQRMVALDEQGNVIGSGEASRRPNMVPESSFIEVIVLPRFQRRGIGAQLYDNAVEFARAHGATRLTCEARDDMPGWLKFAQKRGFEIDRHIFESTLDLAAFDESRFVGVIESVQAQGIRLLALADVGNTEVNQHRLYEVNRRNAQDIPGFEGEFPRFEDFTKYVFQASWFRPEGQILAADGDRCVGLAAVGYFANTNSTYNMHTGVDKEYRGRKIALALKLLAIRCAREWGAKHIRTNNDSQNAPILAINQKLGYKAEPGWFRCLKVLDRVRLR